MWELNYVVSGSVVHCPFPKMKPKYFPFLLAQLRFGWRCNCFLFTGQHIQALPPQPPLLRINRNQLYRADWHRNFVPWYLLYQSIKSQNSLQIQGAKPSTTRKPQQNFKSIFSFLFLSIKSLFLPSSMKGPYKSSGTRTPFLLVGGLFRSSSWKEMKPFPPS